MKLFQDDNLVLLNYHIDKNVSQFDAEHSQRWNTACPSPSTQNVLEIFLSPGWVAHHGVFKHPIDLQLLSLKLISFCFLPKDLEIPKKKFHNFFWPKKWILNLLERKNTSQLGNTCLTSLPHSASAMHLATSGSNFSVPKQRDSCSGSRRDGYESSFYRINAVVFTICKYLLGSAAVFKSKIAPCKYTEKNLVNTGGIPRCCCRPVVVFLAPSSWAQHNTSASASWLSWNASLYETPGASNCVVSQFAKKHNLFPVFSPIF